MYSDIKVEVLRNDLLDYFGTAIESNPMAVMELSRIESASATELMYIAMECGFNIDDYRLGNERGR